MATWRDLDRTTRPGRRPGRDLLYQFGVGRWAFLATVRPDGGPRLAPDVPDPPRRPAARVHRPVAQARGPPARRPLRPPLLPAGGLRGRLLRHRPRPDPRRRRSCGRAVAEQFVAERTVVAVPPPGDEQALVELDVDTVLLTRTTGHGDEIRSTPSGRPADPLKGSPRPRAPRQPLCVRLHRADLDPPSTTSSDVPADGGRDDSSCRRLARRARSTSARSTSRFARRRVPREVQRSNGRSGRRARARDRRAPVELVAVDPHRRVADDGIDLSEDNLRPARSWRWASCASSSSPREPHTGCAQFVERLPAARCAS